MDHGIAQAAITRFKELSALYYRLPGKNTSPEKLAHYNHAQLELFNLAQTIVALRDPCVQFRVDTARRAIVAQLELHFKTGATGAALVRVRRPRRWCWRDAEITPEISFDPSLSGNAVLKPALKELKLALKAQAAVLRVALQY